MHKLFKSALLRSALPVLSAVLIVSVGYGNKYPNPETLVPSSTILFAKSSQIKTLVKSANYMIDSLYSGHEKKVLMAQIDGYKNKSGIDPLSNDSLMKAGIDTDRTAALAYMGLDVQGGERLVVLLPILNEKTFPQKFIEVIKKTSGDEFLDTYPAVTKHGSATIYQVKRDVFGTAFDGYFFIAPTGDTIKEILDMKAGKSALKPTLALDGGFIDYLKKSKNNLDINIFAKKEFLDILANAVGNMFKKPVPNNEFNFDLEEEGKSGEDDSFDRNDNPFEYDGEEGQSFNFMRPFNFTEGDKARFVPVQYSVPSANTPSAFEGVDYVSFSSGMAAKKMIINAGVNFNVKNPMVAMFLELLQTGKTGDLIALAKPSSFGFLSMNLSHLEGLCMNPIPGCQEYNALKTEINNQLGIDVSKEFLPYYSGVINFVTLDVVKGQTAEKTVIFLPMTDESKSGALIKKISEKLVKDLKPQKMGGAVKIGGKNGFWIMNQAQKFFFVSDKRGIYIATTSEIAEAAMKQPLLAENKKNFLATRVKAKQFFLIYASRDIYAGPLTMTAAAEMQKFADRMGDLFLSAERDGGNISFELEIEILDRKEK